MREGAFAIKSGYLGPFFSVCHCEHEIEAMQGNKHPDINTRG
jgi:hypothetical protein